MTGTGPRVLHITTTDISLVLLLGPQLRAFRAAGYDVVTASAPGPWVDELEEWGIEHHPLRHATRAMAPHRDIAFTAELVALLRRLRPDIVHTHNPKPGVYGRVAARLARVPRIVNTVHGLYATPDHPLARRAVVYSLERLAAGCSHAELVQNPEDVTVLVDRLRVPAAKVTLLGNGVALHRFTPGPGTAAVRREVRHELGITDDQVVVGAVGRLVDEKGYPELFDAVARLRRAHPEAVLVVVGPHDPDKADAVAPAVVDAAEAAGVRFLGLRPDVERLYPAMDLYVLASHREGYPRSAMEAAASGLPVVATDIRGCRQVVADGRTGVLVPVRDPAALAGALADLVADPDHRRAMGAAALEKAAAEFDDRRVIDLTLDTYRRLGAPAAAATTAGPEAAP